MADPFLTLVCYDISSDALRSRLAASLENLGMRVQHSVFEVRGQIVPLRRVCMKVAILLDPGDSIRLYPISKAGAGAVEVLGYGPGTEQSDFLLV